MSHGPALDLDDRRELLRLADGYLEGDISPADYTRFRGLLANPEGLREYIYYADMHAALLDVAETPAVGRPRLKIQPFKTARRRDYRWAAASVSAAVAALCVVAAVLFSSPAPNADPIGRVMIVSEDAGEQLLGPSQLKPLRVGQRISLAGGFVGFELGGGFEIDLIGPAEAVVESRDQVRLASGMIVAKVGPGRHGVRVVTEDATVIDLGTEFAVRKLFGGGTDVEVIRGSVEVELRPEDEDDFAVATLVAGQSARLSHEDGDLRYTAGLLDSLPEYEEYITSKGGIARCSGSVVPESRRNLFGLDLMTRPTNGRVLIIAERDATELERDVATTLGVVPAGTNVDSYIVHYEMSERARLRGVGKGAVTFGRPVLGVIDDADGLRDTDALFATPELNLGDRPGRGSDPGEDAWSLSEDRRTLTVDFGTDISRPIDQLRVLVLADESPP
ncbi:MAG: FecR domain-containing protein [Planctomycetota bacterium]